MTIATVTVKCRAHIAVDCERSRHVLLDETDPTYRSGDRTDICDPCQEALVRAYRVVYPHRMDALVRQWKEDEQAAYDELDRADEREQQELGTEA